MPEVPKTVPTIFLCEADKWKPSDMIQLCHARVVKSNAYSYQVECRVTYKVHGEVGTKSERVKLWMPRLYTEWRRELKQVYARRHIVAKKIRELRDAHAGEWTHIKVVTV